MARVVVIALLLLCSHPSVTALNLRSPRRQEFREGMHDEHVFGHIVDSVQDLDLKEINKAANAGNPEAMTTLGTMYSEGIEVTQDDAQSVEWYRKAAELGYVGAQYNLGGMLVSGKGGDKDLERGVYWYKQAAQQMCDPEGHARSCQPKSIIYKGDTLDVVRERAGLGESPVRRLVDSKTGTAVWDTDVNSDEQLNAIVSGSTPIMYDADAGLSRESLTLVSVSATGAPVDVDAIIDDGADKVRPYTDFEEHQAYIMDGQGDMTQGEGVASIIMSSLMMKGSADRKAVQDHLKNEEVFKEAISICEKMANEGDARYALIMGALLQEGHGVEQSAEGAYSMWMAAAKKGSREGMNNVGASLELGAGAKQDVKEALKWYSKAAKAGDPSAMVNLGSMYERGVAVRKRDVKKAMSLYQDAARTGHPGAMNNIGVMYAAGKGVNRDVIEARRWLRRAVEVPSGVWHFTDAFEDNTDNDEYEEDEEDEGSEPLDQFLSPGRDPCPQALYNLGVLQLASGAGGGVGVHRNREAAKWFAMAAEKGIMSSAYEHGRIV